MVQLRRKLGDAAQLIETVRGWVTGSGGDRGKKKLLGADEQKHRVDSGWRQLAICGHGLTIIPTGSWWPGVNCEGAVIDLSLWYTHVVNVLTTKVEPGTP